MALEHTRRQAELKLAQASRARIAEAGDAERRRLERDCTTVRSSGWSPRRSAWRAAARLAVLTYARRVGSVHGR